MYSAWTRFRGQISEFHCVLLLYVLNYVKGVGTQETQHGNVAGLSTSNCRAVITTTTIPFPSSDGNKVLGDTRVDGMQCQLVARRYPFSHGLGVSSCRKPCPTPFRPLREFLTTTPLCMNSQLGYL